SIFKSSATLLERVKKAVQCLKKSFESVLSKPLDSCGIALSIKPITKIPFFRSRFANAPSAGPINGIQNRITTKRGLSELILFAAFLHDRGLMLESHW